MKSEIYNLDPGSARMYWCRQCNSILLIAKAIERPCLQNGAPRRILGHSHVFCDHAQQIIEDMFSRRRDQGYTRLNCGHAAGPHAARALEHSSPNTGALEQCSGACQCQGTGGGAAAAENGRQTEGGSRCVRVRVCVHEFLYDKDHGKAGPGTITIKYEPSAYMLLGAWRCLYTVVRMLPLIGDAFFKLLNFMLLQQMESRIR
eukprot:1151787-Pelagomonas_calceolata.AAC.4